MSDTSQTKGLAEQMSGRWQIPLLALSVALLLAGIWRLRPRPEPPSFDELLAEAVALTEAGFYPEASEYAEKLLAAPERVAEERRELHRLMARIIFEHELGNVVHGAGNVRAILDHGDAALAEGESHDASMHLIRAKAWEWLRRPTEAMAEYGEALSGGYDRPWEIRKRMIEIQQDVGGVTAEDLHDAYGAFLSEEGVSDELCYWAAEQKVKLFGREGKHAEAERFLAAHESAFKESTFVGRYEYLRALAWFHVGRLDDAERELRALRDGLSQADDLYASSGWLLGEILLAQDSPEFGLSFFSEVVDKTVPGPYRTASWLGKAETFAALERFDESVSAYTEVIRLIADNPYGGLVDLREIRESTTARYKELVGAGQLPAAMAYLRIGAKLVPPADAEKQALYAEWMADLSLDLGKAARARAISADAPEGAAAEAKTHLIVAGEQYRRLAKLVSLDEARSSEAIWKSADAFDQGGARRQVVAVLERFVRERPTSSRVPRALFELAQTYQALREFDEAIAKYQRNLERFAGTPSGVASLVPLADCFVEIGKLAEAEQTLLRIVEYRPGESITSIQPAAREYREALFRLGDLYMRVGDFDKGIARYEQVLERYGDDERAGRATFMLAEAYRNSAASIREDLSDSKNVAFVDHLRATHQERLDRARELYTKVIDYYRSRPVQASTPDDLAQLQVKLSHFYRADAVYDLSRVADSRDQRPYAESLGLYGEAAWVYRGDPMVMTAYVQMINCHLRMGNAEKAREMLQRAKWSLRSIADEAFLRHAPEEGRAYWEEYLAGLEQTPTFAVEAGSG